MLKCEVQVQGKEKTIPSDGDGVEVPEPPERREKQLQLTAVMLTLFWRHPAAPRTQVHPVLAAGRRLAHLPELRAALEGDLGTINKVTPNQCRIVSLHRPHGTHLFVMNFTASVICHEYLLGKSSIFSIRFRIM